MTESTKIKHKEQRLLVVFSIVFVTALLVLLPNRIRLFPPWVTVLCAAVEIVPLTAVLLMPGKTAWLKVERAVTYVFCISLAILCMVNLATIINEMVKYSEDVGGMQLLLSGIGVWACNVLAFSILFWILDRGGPICRENYMDKTRRPDWLFPQETAPSEDLSEDWRPAYLDYLFLAFCTGTAFSPTDLMPLTHRAKLLVMLESLISLATVVVVLSRAINILG